MVQLVARRASAWNNDFGLRLPALAGGEGNNTAGAHFRLSASPYGSRRLLERKAPGVIGVRLQPEVGILVGHVPNVVVVPDPCLRNSEGQPPLVRGCYDDDPMWQIEGRLVRMRAPKAGPEYSWKPSVRPSVTSTNTRGPVIANAATFQISAPMPVTVPTMPRTNVTMSNDVSDSGTTSRIR